MESYLLIGSIIGITLWGCKYMLSIAILPKKFNKWLHNNPAGLIIMDTGFGLLAVKTITMAGASGLVTLIVLTSYGACTGILIMKYLIKRKTKEIYASCRRYV